MRTHASDILQIAKSANRDAIEYAGRDHLPQDFKNLLIRLGSAVEVFLKDHVYTGLKNRANFADLIDGLEALGLAAQNRTQLHELRGNYNNAKHEPTYSAEIQSVLATLRASECALGELTKLPIGSMHLASSEPMRRLLWFAAWDHFIGGDTEISIFLPCPPEIDMPYGFETIYTDISSWDQIKSDLANVGKLNIGPEHLPPNVYQVWSGEEDFLAAGSFEGDLRAMISVLAPYERVEDLIPDLKRENEPYSMLAAALFAVTDLSQQGALPIGVTELNEAIIAAAASYAAPATSVYLKSFAKSIAEMLGKCAQSVRDSLAGPLWVGPVRYVELDHDTISEIKEPPVKVLQDGTLVARL